MITARDVELFKKLSKYGMLSTKQVGQLVFKSIATTTVLRRLRLLEAGFYVKRIRGLESQDVLWVLQNRGAILAEVEVPKRHWSKNMLSHDFKLLSLRLALEASGISQNWTPEHLIRSNVFKKNGFRAAKEKLIPDGLMGIEVNGFSQSVAVELELTMKDTKRYEQIFRRYTDKRELHAIWYVGTTDGIVNLVYRTWRKVKSLYRLPNLYVSYLDEVMKDPLKARLLSEGEPKLIGNIWIPKLIEVTAHSPAQGVSSQHEKNQERKVELSAEDHTSNREDVA